jgi:ribonuclease Z
MPVQALTLARWPKQAMAEREDPAQVLFLGTGSAEPSKYRGSAGMHVRLGPGKGLLLDAGEGAWGGLLRHYGPAQARAEVRGSFARAGAAQRGSAQMGALCTLCRTCTAARKL